MKNWKEVLIAFGVSGTIFTFALLESSDRARRPELNRGAEQLVAAAIESEKRLSQGSYHLQALVYDRQLQDLRKLTQLKNGTQRAGAEARRLMAGFYEHQLLKLQENRDAMDLELGKLAAHETSEELVLARFHQLTTPWREVEEKIELVRGLPDRKAIELASNWLERSYQQNIQASGLR
jgi:hypothetical protein